MGNLNNKLIGALIGLAKSTYGSPYLSETSFKILFEGLTLIEDNDDKLTNEMIEKVKEEKYILVPDCSVCSSPCGRTSDFDMKELQLEGSKVLELKTHILLILKKLAKEALEKANNNLYCEDVNQYVCDSLYMITYEDTEEKLFQIIEKAQSIDKTYN